MATYTWSRNGDFLAWVEKLGIDTKTARRVVIDANVGHPLMVYVEMYGESAAFGASPPPVLLEAGIVVGGDIGRHGQLLERIRRLEDALENIAVRAAEGNPTDAIGRVARTALAR